MGGLVVFDEIVDFLECVLVIGFLKLVELFVLIEWLGKYMVIGMNYVVYVEELEKVGIVMLKN